MKLSGLDSDCQKIIESSYDHQIHSCLNLIENKPQINADERTINTFGQHQRYCAGVATPDPDDAPPKAEFSMKSQVANYYSHPYLHVLMRKIDIIRYHFVW
jgi:hypothetical protein